MAETYSPKFDAFNIHSTPYKTINRQDIPVYTFIPKNVKSGHRPLIVRFHGGFLITGSAVFPLWTTSWSLSYALLHSAIILSVNYRLMPESTGLEIQSDIDDFWKWLAVDFPSYLSSLNSCSDISPDLSRVLCYGESAGAYLAVQSALAHIDNPIEGVNIRALIAAYAKVDWDNPELSTPSTTRSPNGAPQMDAHILTHYIDAMEEGKIVTAAFPPERMQLVVVAVQQGRLGELLGSDESLYPLKRLAKSSHGAGKEQGPFLFAFHGRDDTAVPHEETVSLVKAWEDAFGKEKAIMRIESGDHGFDGMVTLETEWLKGGLGEVSKTWLDGDDGET